MSRLLTNAELRNIIISDKPGFDKPAYMTYNARHVVIRAVVYSYLREEISK